MKFAKVIVFLLFYPIFIAGNHLVDLIVFSYNRGTQLYATIESSRKYFAGLNDIYVLYRASDDKYKMPYLDIKNTFDVKLVRQGSNPRADFKPLFINILKQSKASYVLLAVDDIFVKDFVDLSNCAQHLERYNAYAFYLRLGKNINYCYSCKIQSPPPSMKEVFTGVFEWVFNSSLGDWGYPNSVDMTIFRKKDVLRDAQQFNFTAPNIFEGQWAAFGARRILDRTGLCFETSKIVNVPANLVQQSHKNNPHMNSMSPRFLLQKYYEGYKININKFFRMNNNSPHYEVAFDFIKR